MDYNTALEAANILYDIEHTEELIEDLQNMIATKEYLSTSPYLVKILGDACQQCREYKNLREEALGQL